jgi:hypothetical protein
MSHVIEVQYPVHFRSSLHSSGPVNPELKDRMHMKVRSEGEG